MSYQDGYQFAVRQHPKAAMSVHCRKSVPRPDITFDVARTPNNKQTNCMSAHISDTSTCHKHGSYVAMCGTNTRTHWVTSRVCIHVQLGGDAGGRTSGHCARQGPG